MENICQFICLLCVLQSVLWPVKGTYYVKPTGRYEISEIPLPSSVIEQINKNNAYTPIQGPVTPTGVLIQTAATIHISLPPKPEAPCPPPSPCPCPCPQPSSGGNPTSLRPLPNNVNNTQHCPSLCLCLCIGAFPPQVNPPAPLQPGGLNPKVTSPLLQASRPSQSGVVPSFSSATSLNQLAGTIISKGPSAAISTPTILTTSPSTVSSFVQQSTNSVTCPGITGCASSGKPVISVAKTTETPSATPGPTLIPPMIPALAPGAVSAASASTKQPSSSAAIPPMIPALFPGAVTAAILSTKQASSSTAIPPNIPAIATGSVSAASSAAKQSSSVAVIPPLIPALNPGAVNAGSSSTKQPTSSAPVPAMAVYR